MAQKERGARMSEHSYTSIISLDCESKDTTNNYNYQTLLSNESNEVEHTPASSTTPQQAIQSTPVAQTEYVITNITHEVATAPLDYNTPIFTQIKNMYTKVDKTPLSMNQTRDFVNSYNGYNSEGIKLNKHTAPGLLKGMFNATGYDGIDCIQSVGYLFFDIDVKDTISKAGKVIKENVHLFNKADNNLVFEAMKVISPLVWRSNSKYGIAGILVVPQITQYNHDARFNHRDVGEHITNYVSNLLQKMTGVARVTFDQAQSKFRQVRYIAPQAEPRTINATPYIFAYDSETKIKVAPNGVPLYSQPRKTTHSNTNGKDVYTPLIETIFDQYDNDTQILPLMLSKPFEQTHDDNGNMVRVKHPYSSGYDKNVSVGVVDIVNNVFFNHSTSIANGQIALTPSDILYWFTFGQSWTRTAGHLYSLGYKNKPIDNEMLQRISESLTRELKQATQEDIAKVIFKHCNPLKFATNTQKYKFIADNCTTHEYRKYFVEYLKLTDYTIKYDETLIINNWVSEKLTDILSYADTHKHIVCRSETGNGKTFAFVDEFINLHPEKRILILAPLTMIVDQNRDEYTKDKYTPGDYVFLTGKDSQTAYDKVKNAKVIFATYEQGSNWITHKQHGFDYIIVDEIHNLITANSYKPGVIEKLTPLLSNNTVIGLTGSPSQAFSLLGYKILNVTKQTQPDTPIEVRYSNTKAYNVALNHLTRRPTAKVLMRVNSIDTINELTDQLFKLKLYQRSEILHLYSTNEIKNSIDYTDIASRGQFAPQYRLILTTSVIDEGVSINQFGFSDIVYIETDYSPRPEAIKQFFARFRNIDKDRKNIAYLRQKIDQTPTRFLPESMYKDDLNILIEDLATQADATDVLSTYNTIFGNNKYLYDTGNVNPYYLAYAVTNVLFQRMNKMQYLEYLQSNYNLSFTVNEAYEVNKFKANDSTTLERKQRIAKSWINEKDEIYQALRTHTQDLTIQKTITKQQVLPSQDIFNVVIENIKEFEKLFNRSMRLLSLGVNAPDEILINSDVEPITLKSSAPYADEILYQTINRLLNLPLDQQKPGDKKVIKQFIQFAEWCSTTGTFTNKQMMRKLKELRILQSKQFNEKTLFRVLEFFNLDVKRNTKTHVIKCSKK